MTEELKQNAIENVCKRNPFVEKEWFIDAFKKYDKGKKVKYLKDCEIAEYESYIAGATEATKELQEENERLKSKEYFVGDKNRQNMELQQKLEAKEKQIEKMKCCGNCKHHRYDYGELECVTKGCENKSKWELAE